MLYKLGLEKQRHTLREDFSCFGKTLTQQSQIHMPSHKKLLQRIKVLVLDICSYIPQYIFAMEPAK